MYKVKETEGEADRKRGWIKINTVDRDRFFKYNYHSDILQGKM